MTIGISVIVPCHNAAKRLPPTLSHIAAQKISPDLQWEVVVVDNASTDDTSEVALSCWPADASTSLRVVREPRLGLKYAHLRGFAEARFDLICFVEDDNWICPEYLDLAVEIMNQHPDVGACGGAGEAVCEITPPGWFKDYQSCYSVGSQGSEAGDITRKRGWLWGAGMIFRRSAWQSLVERRFQPLILDRHGKELNSGGDIELCLALKLAGWRIWYDPRLCFRHFLAAHRLDWDYLCKLNHGFGVAQAICDFYRYAAPSARKTFAGKCRSSWTVQMALILLRLLRNPHKLLLARYHRMEGDAARFHNAYKLGRLSALVKWRKRYEPTIADIRARFSQGVSP